MGASNTIFAGGSLLAVTVLMGASAHAMEPAQAPSAAPSSAFSLPSFFDGNRVPDLKDAWSAGDIAPAISSTMPAESAPSAPPPSDDAALVAAKAAMVRAEQAGRDAADVRRKAEELSRRFGADNAPVATTESATVGATETAPENVSGPAGGRYDNRLDHACNSAAATLGLGRPAAGRVGRCDRRYRTRDERAGQVQRAGRAGVRCGCHTGAAREKAARDRSRRAGTGPTQDGRVRGPTAPF